jgi:hypothetical protein
MSVVVSRFRVRSCELREREGCEMIGPDFRDYVEDYYDL